MYGHKKTSAGSRGNFLINQSHKKEKIIIKRRNPSLAHKLDTSQSTEIALTCQEILVTAFP